MIEMKVYCKHCQNWHLVKEVEFLNIEEDYQGRDVLTFICNFTNKEEKSNVYRAN